MSSIEFLLCQLSFKWAGGDLRFGFATRALGSPGQPAPRTRASPREGLHSGGRDTPPELEQKERGRICPTSNLKTRLPCFGAGWGLRPRDPKRPKLCSRVPEAGRRCAAGMAASRAVTRSRGAGFLTPRQSGTNSRVCDFQCVPLITQDALH